MTLNEWMQEHDLELVKKITLSKLDKILAVLNHEDEHYESMEYPLGCMNALMIAAQPVYTEMIASLRVLCSNEQELEELKKYVLDIIEQRLKQAERQGIEAGRDARVLSIQEVKNIEQRAQMKRKLRGQESV